MPLASLRAPAVQAPAWIELARHDASRDLPWQAGYAARQALRCDGWREHRTDGGIVIDLGTNEIIACGLFIPRDNKTFSGLALEP